MSMDWLFTFADPTLDWNYAMVTLLVRFIGVFFVMAVMQVALQVSSRIVQRIEAPAKQPVAVSAAPSAGAEAAAAPKVPADALDDATVAAIGLALALESRPAATAAEPASGASSAWATAGRIHQLNRNPR
jgi:hypothetical protein